MKKNKGKKKVFGIVSGILLCAMLFACGFYLSDYYLADMEAISAFEVESPVSRQVLEDGTIVYAKEGAAVGLIFYPGGKVEYTAYEPLMKACAARGMLCVLVEMPFNLAVFDVNAAEGVREMLPQVQEWYLGGHSLGGSMAAVYLEENVEDYEGLVLLGSYSTVDYSDTDLKVLSIYGSEDNVLNREKYEEYRANLPENFTEVVVEGGCHAYFGMYGAQEGDGIPVISPEEQISQTVDAIWEMVNEKAVNGEE